MKKEMLRKAFGIAMAGVMAISMVGCGGGGSSSAASETKSSAAPEASAPAEPSSAPSEAASAVESAVSAASEAGTEKSDITIGVSWCAIESQMWAEYQNTIKAECESLGVKYTESVAENDVQKQNQQIEDFISQGVDAIIIAPADGEAVVSAIQECNTANIPVIMANRAAGEGCEVYATISSDNKAMVKREIEYIVSITPEGTKYRCLELVGSLTDVNAIARQEGFEETIAEYPDMFELVSTVPTEWKGDQALAGVQNTFSADDTVNFIFSPSDALLPSIISGLQQLDKYAKVGEEGHVTLVTFDGAADAVSAIREGYVDVVSVQDATNQAKLCVQAAVDAAGGKEAQDYTDAGFEVSTQNVETDYADFTGY